MAVAQTETRFVQHGEKPESVLSEPFAAGGVICLDLRDSSEKAVAEAREWIVQAHAIERTKPDLIVPCLVVRGSATQLRARDVAGLAGAGAVFLDQAEELPHPFDPGVEVDNAPPDQAVPTTPDADDFEAYAHPPFQLARRDYEEWLQRMRQSPSE